MIEIAVIGGGRIGLPIAVGLAKIGHRVVCCESSPIKLKMMVSGKASFADEGLDGAIKTAFASGNLRFCADIAGAVNNAKVVFMAIQVENCESGVQLLQAVSEETVEAAPTGCVLVIKSTVPPGTCEQLGHKFRHAATIVSNPEFLRQGKGLYDFMNPSRIVVGAADPKSSQVLREIYKPIVAGGAEYIEISRTNAELSKLAANMFLSSRVTLINELADVCEQTGADINEVIKVISTDKRVGSQYLHPGTGFGGTCLPKDGRLLMETAQRYNIDIPTIEAIYKSNCRRAEYLAERILTLLPPSPKIAAWGITFKPETDDAKTSPAVAVIRALCVRGVRVQACNAGTIYNMPENMPSSYKFFSNCFESLVDTDMLIVLVGHQEYTLVPPKEISRRMKGKHIFDCAGVFDPEEIGKAGLIYNAVGVARKNLKQKCAS